MLADYTRATSHKKELQTYKDRTSLKGKEDAAPSLKNEVMEICVMVTKRMRWHQPQLSRLVRVPTTAQLLATVENPENSLGPTISCIYRVHEENINTLRYFITAISQRS